MGSQRRRTPKRQPARAARSAKSGDLESLQRARAFWARGQFPTALRLFDQTVRRHPQHAVALADAGRAFGSVYMYARAEMLLERLEQMGRDRAELQHLAGQSYRLIRRPAAARRCFERAAERKGTPRDCYLELALLAERSGDLASAHDWAQMRLRGQLRDAEGAVALGRILRKQGQTSRAESLLADVLKMSDAHWLTRQFAAYELAGLYDEQADFASAWPMMLRAKEIARPHSAAARQHRNRMLDALVRLNTHFRPEHLARWREDQRERPPCDTVLLTGLPRSGTTLLEHMLAAHPQVVAADEWDLFPRWIFPALVGYRPLEQVLPDALERVEPAALARKRHLYLRGMSAATEAALGGKLLLDKNPSLLPLVVAYLRLLPNSRVVLVRRDPRDTLVSCLFTPMGLNDFGVDFLDVDQGAKRIAMELQHATMLRERLGDAVMEVRYEELVEDWQSVLRRLLPRVGELEWQEGVLGYRESEAGYLQAPSYAAVQRPITAASIARWKNYAPQLDPVLEQFERLV